MRLLNFAKHGNTRSKGTSRWPFRQPTQQSAQCEARPRRAVIQTPTPFLELGHVTYSLESMGLEVQSILFNTELEFVAGGLGGSSDAGCWGRHLGHIRQ